VIFISHLVLILLDGYGRQKAVRSPQKTQLSGVIFAIAGFDPSSGAGATADLKTVAALGGYGVACLTALTVQSTLGVRRTESLPGWLVRETLITLAEDTPPAAIKIGMLHTAEVAEAVAEFLAGWQGVPTVLDPVLRSSSGAELLDAGGLAVMRQRILPLVRWVTPNLAEAAALSGRQVSGIEDIPEAATELRRLYPQLNVVVTGGHLAKPDDYLLSSGGSGSAGVWIQGEKIDTTSTHGTGCAFSTALAVSLAGGAGPEEAARAAKDYVTGALRHSPGIGHGRGPIGHLWRAGTSSE
jgi:hydroxymethylpyrimidine/phosphomethylpyrimidine kinase